MPHCVTQSRLVAIRAQAADEAYRQVGQIRVMPEGLSLIQIGQMYFNKWDRDPGQRIANCDAGVRICRRVDDDEVRAVLPGRLYAVNQRAFVIALPRCQRDAHFACKQLKVLIDLLQREAAVDMRFSGAEQVQVRAMQYQYVLRHALANEWFANCWQNSR